MYTRVRKRPMSEINVVPYIDVMLVLLVIFMITAPLLHQGIEVELPQMSAEPLPPDKNEPIVVNIDHEGNFYINYGESADQPVSDSELVKRVKTLLKLQPKTRFYVGGDTEALYGHITHVMVLLQQAGVRDLGMLTEPPTQAPRPEA